MTSEPIINFSEIAAEIEDLELRLAEVADDAGPEAELLTDFIQRRIDERTSDMGDLVDDCIKRIAYAESQITAAKQMRDKWISRARYMERVATTTRTLALNVLKSRPEGKLRGTLGTMQKRRNAEALRILDANQIPTEYMIEELQVFPDKERIKEELKAGKEIPGVELYRGEHLWIG